jgi:hypothetical protein
MVAPMEESLEAIITQTVLDEADSQSNVGMEDPGVEEVSLAPMAAMITQNPNSQESCNDDQCNGKFSIYHFEFCTISTCDIIGKL